MDNAISTLNLQAMKPGEALHDVTIEVGTPYFSEQDGRWYCAVAMDGLYPVRNAAAGDSFQVLCMAVGLILNLLAAYEGDGGILYFPASEGEEPLLERNRFPLDAYRLKPIAPRLT